MGLVFEELIRRFAESSNETAGEHFTPRDIVNLTTSLVFRDDDDALSKEGLSELFTTQQPVLAVFFLLVWSTSINRILTQ